MFADIKKTVKHTAVYSLGNISTKLVGFILLPLYTTHLSTEEYGILAILQAIAQILIGVFGLSLPTAMMRWAAPEQDNNKQKSIVFTTLIATVIIAASLCGILLPMNELFSLKLFYTTDYSSYFTFLFLAVSAGIINNVPLNLVRLKEQAGFYVVITTLKFTLIVLCNIYFVAHKEIGVEGIILSELIGHLFVILVTIPVTIKNSIAKFDWSAFIGMIQYGAPLVFSIAFTFILTLGDRFIIKFFLGDSSVGVYSLGHRIGSVINMLILQSFQLGFVPLAYKKLNDPNAKRYYAKVLTYYTLVLVSSGMVLSIFSKELIILLAKNKEYWIAYSVVPIVAFAFVLKGIQYTFALSFHYTKKTGYSAVIFVIGAIINLSLNIVLVQKYDFLGAAVSLIVSVILMLILSYIFGQRVYKIPYEITKIYKILFIGLLCYISSVFTSGMEFWSAVFIKIILVLFFPILLYILRVFDNIEIESFKKGVRDFINLFKK